MDIYTIKSTASLNRDKNKSSLAAEIVMMATILLTITVVDRWLLPNYSLAIFYLFPISYAIYLWRIQGGLALCLLSVLLAKVILQTASGAWEIGIQGGYWDLVTLFGFYMAIAQLEFLMCDLIIVNRNLLEQDTNTGMLNRNALMSRLVAEINRAGRMQKNLSVAYLDIDNFKALNDSRGHAFGDVVIQSLDDFFTVSLRDYDVFARMGGDEFAIIFPETASQHAQEIIKRIQLKFITLQMKNMLEADGLEMTDENVAALPPITFSAGVVTYHSPNVVATTIVQEADRLMYQAKKKGGNQLCAEDHQPS